MIRILEDRVVNRIAAGEVVERPAAVVKELVENSLDAGATDVRVALRAGGRDLIQVTDNGRGMGRLDATLCLERHATSKIREFEDLERVRTLGFRGEALPSIASVSRFDLRTRLHDEATGTRVSVEGGRLAGVRDDGGPPGTTISVRSLFFNVPARRKFLRTVATELSHCVEAVRRQCLLRPGLDIEVLHDGRTLLRSAASTDPRARLHDVLGTEADQLLAVDFSEGELRCVGHIAPHDVHRNSANGAAYHFVNGRFVRDPLVRRAVAEAYRGLVPRGRHPVVAIDLRLPTDLVDCNVHPAKTEVRFADGRRVQRMLAEGLRRVLEDRGIKQRGSPRPQAAPVARGAEGPTQLTLTGEELPTPLPPRVPAPRPAPAPPPPGEARPAPTPPAAAPAPATVAAPAPPRWQPRPPLGPPGGRPPLAPAPRSWAPPPPRATPPPAPAGPAAPVRAFRELRVLGQIGSTRVACADGEDLIVIDQDAARRAAIRAELARSPERLPLAEPAVVASARPVGAAAAACEALGLELGDFGEGSVLVRAVPRALSGVPPATLVAAALGPDTATDPKARIAALAACAPSLAGRSLSPYELRGLLRRLDELGLSPLHPPPGLLVRLPADHLAAAIAKGQP